MASISSTNSKVSFSPSGFIDLFKGKPERLPDNCSESWKYGFSMAVNKSITILFNDNNKISGVVSRVLMYGYCDEVLDYKQVNGKITKELKGYRPCTIVFEEEDSSSEIEVAFSKGKTLHLRGDKKSDYEDNVSAIILDLDELKDEFPALQVAFEGVLPQLGCSDFSELGEDISRIIAEYTVEMPAIDPTLV